MCRPWSYQVFVFVGERFAGTLSPVLMDARTDGAWQAVRIGSRLRLAAEFLRYTRRRPALLSLADERRSPTGSNPHGPSSSPTSWLATSPLAPRDGPSGEAPPEDRT